ncbi:DUF3224 domain-containing protein (plasmid) [Devosia neptuniae]|uniref:DUF3224 domain-containing protein n=1 Tax=Devosia neptuniae TaxID=191302 RepID=A0ABY6C684_9HYPH|nr:DUF3224 domain-containing protein [Devosia neptuniae]UXN67805.1 DUF3224 domain-containing protein [Devosia neptuniae]
MKARGTFTVSNFKPTQLAPVPAISTAMPVGVSTMEKTYSGGIVGRSATIFTAAFDQASGVGSYVAMESFEGTIAGRTGTFNFLHSASTKGSDRSNEFIAIVEGSGTGGFSGISGAGQMTVDADGTHHLEFDFQIVG